MSRFIGQHFHFRRTGRHINGYIVKRHLLLGCHHILVARSEYLVNLWNTLRSVSHGSNSLNTARLEYLTYTSHLSCIQDGRIHLSLLVGRCTKNNLLASRNLGRNSQHQHGREQRSCSSWDIQTYLLNSYSLLPTNDTRNSLYLLAFELLCSMERMDILLSQQNRLFQFCRDQSFGFHQLSFTDGQCIQFHLIEAFFVFNDRLIALLFDTAQHFIHRIAKYIHIHDRTFQQGRPFILIGIINLSHLTISFFQWAEPGYLRHPRPSTYR